MTTLRSLALGAATRVQRRLLGALGAGTVGVRAIVERGDGALLLVRHSYRPGWFLVGGGVDARETPLDAIVREMREEAGIVARAEPALTGAFHHVIGGVDDYVLLYLLRDFVVEPCACAEIAETGWFDPHALPEPMSPGSHRRVIEHRDGRPRSGRW